tara:strand:- start:3967 stop:4638 length:672 start_codon:yes stop_codon:yes gene_type:complete
MSVVIGIDEAGRGPVLGPLVMAAVAVDKKGLKKLEELGVKDSKLLTADKRLEIFEQLADVVTDYRVQVIEPTAIDLTLASPGTNLNWLEADTAASMVNEMEHSKVIVDCPSVNIDSFKDYFVNKLTNKKATVILEHKADMNHLVVAAASIVAKVIRDMEIEKIKSEVGIDFGSGYMSDSLTVSFLNECFETHDYIFRRNWASYQQRVRLKQQKTLGEFDDESW